MPRNSKKNIFVFLISVCLLSQSQQVIASGRPDKDNFTSYNSATDITRFAAIGDYGKSGQPEADVAALVKSWSPDFIITTGDNNYNSGEATTIDANIGQYYRQYIHPYSGSYGTGGNTNNFYPSLGNHDWVTKVNLLPQPYLDYFSLPGNERYYDFTRGVVHFYAIDSDPSEPDGISSNSVQGQWLQAALAASTESWNIVYFHHSPYSSGSHGSNTTLQWPFQDWGADIVLTGHDHTYERLLVNNFPYIVNGLGGYPIIYNFNTPVSGSVIRYNSDYGAILAEATSEYINFKFITRNGDMIDSYTLGTPASATFADVPLDHPYFADIEILYANGFTAGCSTSPLLFCPEETMNRGQSAVFILRGNFGPAYVPPNPPFPVSFNDNWAPGPWAQKWAQGMLEEGLTAGCSTSPLLYCPWEQMPRLQAAVFGMRLKEGNAYNPPAATGTVFADITDLSLWYAKWAEAAYNSGILPACGMQGGKPLFCPNELVSRGLGAYMIVRAKNLSMP